ncbi:oxidoreductase NAD-binding domain-containing protein 1-like [Macrobrachium rosenbergii]|uniref:oxidoreductase NAD-binding domain-containing protein 1-like n=1 Tax=Macrobrachium rosenbergii TaxID=79674 RepID=UPI0034D66D60
MEGRSSEPVRAEAVVTEVRSESPSVKGFTLRIDNPRFDFKPGQWVDLFVPGIETIGGYSMYSSPKQLTEQRTIDLALKYSDWPPTLWMHEQCKVNSKVEVRVGGNIYYDPVEGGGQEGAHDLLLVAGGVGINPLSSIYRHADDLHKPFRKDKEGCLPGRVSLLCSAKTKEELLFKPTLDAIAEENPKIDVKYFVTQEKPGGLSDVNYGRINNDVLKTSLEALNLESLKVFVCGPESFIDDIEMHLLNNGVAGDRIFYERWW